MFNLVHVSKQFKYTILKNLRRQEFRHKPKILHLYPKYQHKWVKTAELLLTDQLDVATLSEIIKRFSKNECKNCVYIN